MVSQLYRIVYVTLYVIKLSPMASVYLSPPFMHYALHDMNNYSLL